MSQEGTSMENIFCKDQYRFYRKSRWSTLAGEDQGTPLGRTAPRKVYEKAER